jgi:hypothetical protein
VLKIAANKSRSGFDDKENGFSAGSGDAAGLSRQQNCDSRVVAHRERCKMPPDQEFLLYPLDTGEDPLCPCCHLPMLLVAREVRDGKPDFLTFRCEQCGGSEKFVCENEATD